MRLQGVQFLPRVSICRLANALLILIGGKHIVSI
jgi:hypothetical protein